MTKSFLTLCTAILLACPATAADLPAPLAEDDFFTFDPAKARLGQLLFYDKILSGNKNISCGTCHHATLGGSDGLSLGIGEGGLGLGPDRIAGADPITKRIPRNAPALWNIAHKDLTAVFHDGRLAKSAGMASGFDSPAGPDLPLGLETIIAAQAMFPITAEFEMSGNPGENTIADALENGFPAAWDVIANRVAGIPDYQAMFTESFDTVSGPEDITIVEIGNAIAAFVGTEWKNHDSPFDAYLTGDMSALTDKAMRGMDLFYGEAACGTCHSGTLMTDQAFHGLALPEFGPGRPLKGDSVARDVGRMEKTGQPEDAYLFRTPPLRNVALTAPYGHNGAYATLEGMVRHHLNPVPSLAAWTPDMAVLPDMPDLLTPDLAVQSDPWEMQRLKASVTITPVALPDEDVQAILAFLNALTGETAETLPFGRPDRVPSGLPVD